MLFALFGFVSLYRRNRSIFWACAAYFIVSFYIIASWTEWWYGAAFSCRPLQVTYPILLICLGYFILFIKEKRWIWQAMFGLLVAFSLFMNQFYWWQYRHYILDPYRTTKAYFWATFLKTTASEADRSLLLVARDFTGAMHFEHPEDYQSKVLYNNNFEEDTLRNTKSETGNHYYQMRQEQEFCNFFSGRYKKLTKKDHIWVKISVDVRFPACFEGEKPCMVTTMQRRNGAYGYYAPAILPDTSTIDTAATHWQHVEFYYLTPEIRDVRDELKCYIWKRSATPFDLDNIRIEAFEKR
jgi:hypothetical protein